MRIKEITVGTSRKLGLPGYSSFDVSAFVTVELEKNDDAKETYKKAWKTIEEQVVSRITLKGLESPIAAEAQNPSDPNDWMNHESPSEQKGKIKSAKILQDMSETLTKENKGSIPSVKPHMKGGV